MNTIAELNNRRRILRQPAPAIPDNDRPPLPNVQVRLCSGENWTEKRLNPLNKESRLMKNGFYTLQTREDICEQVWDLLDAKKHVPKARCRKCSMIGKATDGSQSCVYLVEVCKVPDGEEGQDDLEEDSDVFFVHFSRLNGSPKCFDNTVNDILDDLKWARDFEMEE